MSAPTPIPLQGVTPAMLVEAFPGIPLSDARKLVAQVHRDETVKAHSALSCATVDTVMAGSHVPTLGLHNELRSKVDPFVKHVLRTAEGGLIETVRIPLEKAGRFSVCVSSQLGCALACAFCATGRMGLSRNLQAWEIVEQVRVVSRTLKAEGLGRVHGVVFQGMGEPLANLDRVLTAIQVLSDPCTLAVDQRAMTVSTSGLPAGILRLAKEAPKVRLGLSLHSARKATRRSIMPIEGAHSLDDVMDAVVEHARLTGLGSMWSITPLSGVNDSVEEAHAVAALALDYRAKTGRTPRISLIPYNSIGEGASDPFVRQTAEQEALFRDALAEAGLPTHKRYSGGGDVGAACGQLSTLSQAG